MPEKIVNINHAENVFIQKGASVDGVTPYPENLRNRMSRNELLRLDRSFYHLFILEDSPYESGTFKILRGHCMKYMPERNVKKFNSVEPEIISLLMSFPAIFAAPNVARKHPDQFQEMCLGAISKITPQDDFIKIEWRAYATLPQKLLNDNEVLFDVWTTTLRNELDIDHWAVKEIPLLESLSSVGFSI